jgi:hypothetical protein
MAPAAALPHDAVARALAFVGAAVPGSNPRALLTRLIRGGQTADAAASYLVALALLVNNSPSKWLH